MCWGRLRSAGGTNAAPTTCAMVFLRGGCEARHQRPPCRRGRTGRGQSGLGSWLWALERSAAPVCALLRAFLFYSYQTSSKKLLADDGVWTSRRSQRTTAQPLGTSRGAAQPSNAAFETKCAWAWRALDARRDVFVEDEEGHVGRCFVPWLSTCAARRPRRRVGRRARGAPPRDYAEDEAADAGGARARLDAAQALVAKRLGPGDTARAKRFLDAGDLTACARLLLARYYDKLYDRHLGRRGDAVLAVRAADPFDADAVADAVVAAVSRADAADLPPPPPVEATRPPPRDRDDDGVQWCAPS